MSLFPYGQRATRYLFSIYPTSVFLSQFRQMRRFLLAIILTILVVPAFAHVIPEMGIDVRPSYTFSSFQDDLLKTYLDLENAKKTRAALSLHLKWGFTYPETSKQNSYIPGAWQGIGVGLNFFGNPKGIGNPEEIYLYQGAPVWHITRRLSLYYEWNFGISVGWKPCNGEMARSNLIVGSEANAYINLGSGLRWDLGKGCYLTAGIDLTHFSNGNTAYPNPGVNMAGLRIGITQSVGTNSQSYGKNSHTNFGDTPVTDKSRYHGISTDTLSGWQRLGWDVTLYGAYRKRVYRGIEPPALLNGTFGIAGISVSPLWKVAPIFRAGVSADFQWDESTNLKRYYVSGSTTEDLHFYRPPFFSQVSGGLSARAELVMPIFSVNVGIGYNVFGPPESRASYQLANLKIRLVKGLFLNIGYQLLDFHRQNNLMLGLGYSFRH